MHSVVWVRALARRGNGRFRLSQSNNLKALLIFFLLKIHLLADQELGTLNNLCLLATDSEHRNCQELLLICICSGSWGSKWILHLIPVVSGILLLISLLLMEALLGKFVSIEHMLPICSSIVALAETIPGWGSLDHFVAHGLLRLCQVIIMLMPFLIAVSWVEWFSASFRASSTSQDASLFLSRDH